MTVGRGHFAQLGLVLAGAVAAACFSEHTPTAPGSAVVCSVPLGPGVAGSTLIAIRDFSFQANNVHVKAGSSVTWVNCEPAGLRLTRSTSDQGVWDSPLLAPGETFTEPSIHPACSPTTAPLTRS